jgi:hypothetical protein
MSAMPGGASIEVVLIPKDDNAAELLAAVKQFPAYTVERYEIEAFLFMTLMRVSHRHADRLREIARQQRQRAERRQEKGA